MDKNERDQKRFTYYNNGPQNNGKNYSFLADFELSEYCKNDMKITANAPSPKFWCSDAINFFNVKKDEHYTVNEYSKDGISLPEEYKNCLKLIHNSSKVILNDDFCSKSLDNYIESIQTLKTSLNFLMSNYKNDRLILMCKEFLDTKTTRINSLLKIEFSKFSKLKKANVVKVANIWVNNSNQPTKILKKTFNYYSDNQKKNLFDIIAILKNRNILKDVINMYVNIRLALYRDVFRIILEETHSNLKKKVDDYSFQGISFLIGACSIKEKIGSMFYNRSMKVNQTYKFDTSQSQTLHIIKKAHNRGDFEYICRMFAAFLLLLKNDIKCTKDLFPISHYHAVMFAILKSSVFEISEYVESIYRYINDKISIYDISFLTTTIYSLINILNFYYENEVKIIKYSKMISCKTTFTILFNLFNKFEDLVRQILISPAAVPMIYRPKKGNINEFGVCDVVIKITELYTILSKNQKTVAYIYMRDYDLFNYTWDSYMRGIVVRFFEHMIRTIELIFPKYGAPTNYIYLSNNFHYILNKMELGWFNCIISEGYVRNFCSNNEFLDDESIKKYLKLWTNELKILDDLKQKMSNYINNSDISLITISKRKKSLIKNTFKKFNNFCYEMKKLHGTVYYFNQRFLLIQDKIMSTFSTQCAEIFSFFNHIDFCKTKEKYINIIERVPKDFFNERP